MTILSKSMIRDLSDSLVQVYESTEPRFVGVDEISWDICLLDYTVASYTGKPVAVRRWAIEESQQIRQSVTRALSSMNYELRPPHSTPRQRLEEQVDILGEQFDIVDAQRRALYNSLERARTAIRTWMSKHEGHGPFYEPEDIHWKLYKDDHAMFKAVLGSPTPQPPDDELNTQSCPVGSYGCHGYTMHPETKERIPCRHAK